MDAQSYCDSLVSELTGWKAKMYDVVRKFNEAPCEAKDELTPQVNDLNMIVQDLSDRIHQLRAECPAEFSKEQEEIEGKLGQLREKWERFNMFPPGRRLHGSNL